ncbi:MAG: PAS domain S-box protein [Thermovirgaceae bacterium]|nr:PAS domain S-box protein [Thermovirgaceae bacterium]
MKNDGPGPVKAPEPEALYRALFEKSPEGLAHCDQHTRILMVNDQFCLMFGYQREEIIGRKLEDVVIKNASFLDEAKNLDEEYLRSGILQIETVRQKKDGTSFPVSIFASPVLAEHIQAGSLYIYRDITDHRKRENEIRASEAKLRGILESHPELILRFTPDLVTTYANKAYCEYHGISFEEGVGRPFTDNIAPEHIPLVHAKLLALTPENSGVTGEEKVVMRSGEMRWQEWTDQGIFDEDGRLIEIQSVGRDITDRKKLEEALAFERESLDMLFQNAGEGIILCENDGTIVKANPAFLQMFGYSLDEVISRNIDDLVAPEPSLHEEAMAITQATANGEHVAAEVSRQRKDGSSIEVSILGVTVHMSEGAEFVYAIYRDISERKRAEQELLRLNRELFISATTDKLTGLISRHHFEEIMQREIAKSSRYGTPLSMIMIDLDSFKKLNDTCGHLAGDRALKTIAGIIEDNIRASDMAARWGGDEFILASPTQIEHTAALAEKIRQLLLSLTHEGFGPIKASLGISSCTKEDTIDSLTKRADDSMYAAKRNGGNLVVSS